MKKYRAWAEININSVIKNLKYVKSHVQNSTKILVVVKSDAYGHGAIPISKTVLENGAVMVGVGDSSEAIELREAGILSPILILGAIIEEEIGWIVSFDIDVSIHSMDIIHLLESEARRQNKRVKVHLKVDTGLGRLGASPKRSIEIAEKIKDFPHIELCGISSHLSSIASDEEFTLEQIKLFKETSSKIESVIGYKLINHLGSSAACFKFPQAHLDMVRTGGFIYGINASNLNLDNYPQSVLSFKSQIAFLKGVKAGTPVGYHHTHYTKHRTKIATIPVGYNDGYPYQLSNKGSVIIRDKLAPVIGLVTMDYIMVDVGHIHGISIGDEAILIGKSDNCQIKVEDLAKTIQVNPYVITCAIGKRIKKIYTE